MPDLSSPGARFACLTLSESLTVQNSCPELVKPSQKKAPTCSLTIVTSPTCHDYNCSDSDPTKDADSSSGSSEFRFNVTHSFSLVLTIRYADVRKRKMETVEAGTQTKMRSRARVTVIIPWTPLKVQTRAEKKNL